MRKHGKQPRDFYAVILNFVVPFVQVFQMFINTNISPPNTKKELWHKWCSGSKIMIQIESWVWCIVAALCPALILNFSWKLTQLDYKEQNQGVELSFILDSTTAWLQLWFENWRIWWMKSAFGGRRVSIQQSQQHNNVPQLRCGMYISLLPWKCKESSIIVRCLTWFVERWDEGVALVNRINKGKVWGERPKCKLFSIDKGLNKNAFNWSA